jgi:hypothetical protein
MLRRRARLARLDPRDQARQSRIAMLRARR